MSSNNLSQIGGKRTPSPQANNSEDGARPKGTSQKKDKKSGGKDEKPKEEIKRKTKIFKPEAGVVADFNAGTVTDESVKEPILNCLKEEEAEPLAEGANDKKISFSYQDKGEVLKLKSIVVDLFKAHMIGRMHKALEAFDKQICDSLREVMTVADKARIKYLNMCNFSSLRKDFVEGAEELIQNTQKEEAEPLPEGANDKTISFSYLDKGEVLMPKSEVVDRFKTQMIDHMHKALVAFDKQIFDSLRKVMTDADKARIKDPDMCNFSSLRKDFVEGAEELRQNTQKNMLKEMRKFDTASKLGKDHLKNIREAYQQDWNSKELSIKQRAVVLYLIDKLALRAGYKKKAGETGTVGCCTLRVEHIKLKPINLEDEEQEYVVEFNFLGKARVRYHKEVPVEKIVYDNIEEFKGQKGAKEELFDLVTPEELNDYLKDEFMTGLTAKVFRTYNASVTLQDQLKTLPVGKSDRKAFDRANLAVAILLNHRSSENLAPGESVVESLTEQMANLDIDPNNKFHLIASKISYLDPRIIVAWCRKRNVPVEEIYSPALMQKFKWAIDMAEDLLDYEF